VADDYPSMAEIYPPTKIKIETDPFEIAVIQNENAMMRERLRDLALENAELKALLAKRNAVSARKASSRRRRDGLSAD
jgi:hypothetical protein